MMPPKNQTQRIDELLGGVTEELLLGNPQQFDDNSIRVERLLLEMVRPDPIQPRRVLPEQLHFAFHSNRLTPTQALKELVQLVQVAARQRGRPFNNVLELLPNPDDESDEDLSTYLSPEEQLLHDLVNLAVTIRDDGQVNPLTVVDITQGVTQQFRIETGERRYWATWLLRDFIANYSGDGMIPCIIIPAERSSIFRQAKENTARAGLSAIAMARQAALLLLTIHGYQIPTQAVSNDFYRQALELDLRGKREYTEAVLSAMGGIDKARFSRLKALLHLSDEAMELADRHDIDEKKLRYLLSLPSEFHVEIVRQIIDFDLSSKQVRDLCQSDEDKSNETDEDEKLSPSAIKIARVTQTISATSAQDIARALLLQEGDPNMARARVQAMYKLLLETERYLGNE
jgi:ParB family transcriptional regulator, chromosome partitioning protein